MPELNELYGLDITEISIVGGIGKAGPAVQDSKILVIKSDSGDENMENAPDGGEKGTITVTDDEVFTEDGGVPELTFDDLSETGKDKVAKVSFMDALKSLVPGRGKEDEGDVEKAKDFDEVASEKHVMTTVREHFDILMQALYGAFGDCDAKNPMADAEKAVKQFTASLLKSLKDIKSGKVSKEELTKEVADYVEKAGAVFSKKNLSELQKAEAIISSLIAMMERSGVSKEEGANKMTEELKREIDGVEYVSKDAGKTFAKVEPEGEEEDPTKGKDAAEEKDKEDGNTEAIMKDRAEFKQEIVKAVGEAVGATIEEKLKTELDPLKEKLDGLEKKFDDSETTSAEVRKDVEALMRVSGSPKGGDLDPVEKSEEDDESFVGTLGLDGSAFQKS